MALPTRQALRRKFPEYEADNQAAYVLNTARAIARGVFAGSAMDVEESDDLEPVCWSAFPVEVDGVRVVVDFSDYLLLDPQHSAHDHWLRFHYTSAFKPFPSLGVFPRQTFHDWAEYLQVSAEVAAARSPEGGHAVLNNQAPGPEFDSRHRRRMLVRGMLHYHFPRRADFQWTPRRDFWRKAVGALCYVHVPGSTENMIDRGWAQMLAMGVPVVSPPMHDYLGPGGPPLAGVHYLACRDDYADLIEKVDWCEANREEAFRVGVAGREFFLAQATPVPIWGMVKARLDSAGACIDCDLPGSEVRCKHPA